MDKKGSWYSFLSTPHHFFFILFFLLTIIVFNVSPPPQLNSNNNNKNVVWLYWNEASVVQGYLPLRMRGWVTSLYKMTFSLSLSLPPPPSPPVLPYLHRLGAPTQQVCLFTVKTGHGLRMITILPNATIFFGKCNFSRFLLFPFSLNIVLLECLRDNISLVMTRFLFFLCN